MEAERRKGYQKRLQNGKAPEEKKNTEMYIYIERELETYLYSDRETYRETGLTIESWDSHVRVSLPHSLPMSLICLPLWSSHPSFHCMFLFYLLVCIPFLHLSTFHPVPSVSPLSPSINAILPLLIISPLCSLFLLWPPMLFPLTSFAPLLQLLLPFSSHTFSSSQPKTSKPKCTDMLIGRGGSSRDLRSMVVCACK